MKKNTGLLFLIILFFAFTACGGAKHMEYDFSDYETLPPLKDGTYTGEVNKGLDKAKVELTIKDGRITAVNTIELLAFAWRKEATVPFYANQLVKKQTINLDAVSGATGSLHAFKIAVSRALDKARK